MCSKSKHTKFQRPIVQGETGNVFKFGVKCKGLRKYAFFNGKLAKSQKR